MTAVESVLLICSSTDGQTRRICERLRQIIEDSGDTVSLVMIEDARDVSPPGVRMTVIGARIRSTEEPTPGSSPTPTAMPLR